MRQGGSLVAPERLRFDFTHFVAMDPEQVVKVERLVNAKIFENHPARAYETSLRSAREAGVTALFGEKYGDFVRVLEVGNFSKELCGGTHVGQTSEIGFLKIVSEGSVGANLRRIEAVTSFDAFDYVTREEDELSETARELKVQPFDVSERVGTLLARLKEAQQAADRTREALSESDISALLESRVDVGYALLVLQLPFSVTADGMRAAADIMRARMGGGAVVLASDDPESGRPLLLAAASEDAVAAGFDAAAVIKHIAPAVKGGGGGKPAMAQAGGSDASGIGEALALARQMLGAEA